MNLTEEEKERNRIITLHEVLKNDVIALIMIKKIRIGLNDYFRHMWE